MALPRSSAASAFYSLRTMARFGNFWPEYTEASSLCEYRESCRTRSSNFHPLFRHRQAVHNYSLSIASRGTNALILTTIHLLHFSISFGFQERHTYISSSTSTCPGLSLGNLLDFSTACAQPLHFSTIPFRASQFLPANISSIYFFNGVALLWLYVRPSPIEFHWGRVAMESSVTMGIDETTA